MTYNNDASSPGSIIIPSSSRNKSRATSGLLKRGLVNLAEAINHPFQLLLIDDIPKTGMSSMKLIAFEEVVEIVGVVGTGYEGL